MVFLQYKSKILQKRQFDDKKKRVHHRIENMLQIMIFVILVASLTLR
jgi:hypothetical protein